MDDSQLQAFMKAYEAGSFRKASKGLFLTLPSFVRKISSLEAELGHDLFIRTTHGITPTSEGEFFYSRATQILDLIESTKSDIGLNPAAEPIRVGIWWRTSSYILEAAQQFFLLHPEVKIDFVETNWNSFARDLSTGSIDVYFGHESYQASEQGLIFKECCRQSFHCAFSPHSALAALDVVTPEDLEEYTVYAGGDWRTIPHLTPAAISFFSRENVIKESIFTDQLIIECMQDQAVSIFFTQSNSLMPSLEFRPFDWPTIAAGVTYRNDSSPILLEFIDICCSCMTKCLGQNEDLEDAAANCNRIMI